MYPSLHNYDTWKLASPPEYDLSICEEYDCQAPVFCTECGLCPKHCRCERDELEGDLSDRLYDEWRERMMDDVR